MTDKQLPISEITLRDYFAAKAMQASINDRDSDEELEDFANWAYAVADAMLEVRNGKN